MNWKTQTVTGPRFRETPASAVFYTRWLLAHSKDYAAKAAFRTQQKMPLHYTPMFNMVHVQKETLLFDIQSLSFECALQVFDGLTICLIH